MTSNMPPTVTPIADTEIERILIVTAHPDDLDFGAAGTIAQWTDKGISVSYCVATNGDQGGVDPSVSRAQMPKIRQQEQRDAGKVVGVTDIHFLNYVDGHLEATIELRKEIVRVIRKVRPQRMVIQNPERNWERIFSSHPDHMAAGEAAMQAVYPDAGNPFAFEDLLKSEGLEPWTVQEVWVISPNFVNHFVDITKTMERKLAAIKAHVSQTAHSSEIDDRIREWGTRNAEAQGLPEGSYAETFRVVVTA
jgi:LmbE family N-acetylglucosaminyl deacetylase